MPASGRPDRHRRGAPYRGGFFGKPLRSIFHFEHQDAPSPPLQRSAGEGAGGEGQKPTGMQNTPPLSQELYP